MPIAILKTNIHILISRISFLLLYESIFICHSRNLRPRRVRSTKRLPSSPQRRHRWSGRQRSRSIRLTKLLLRKHRQTSPRPCIGGGFSLLRSLSIFESDGPNPSHCRATFPLIAKSKLHQNRSAKHGRSHQCRKPIALRSRKRRGNGEIRHHQKVH